MFEKHACQVRLVNPDRTPQNCTAPGLSGDYSVWVRCYWVENSVGAVGTANGRPRRATVRTLLARSAGVSEGFGRLCA